MKKLVSILTTVVAIVSATDKLYDLLKKLKSEIGSDTPETLIGKCEKEIKAKK